MTDCRMRTIGAAPVLACATAAAIVLMTGSVALGYRLAQSTPALMSTTVVGGKAFDISRPEGRALVDHVGDLSGRLMRLEIEAAELARKLGVTPRQTASAPTGRAPITSAPITSAPTAHAASMSQKKTADAQPRGHAGESRGGPWLPVTGAADTSTAAASHAAGYDGIGLAQLESEIELLEASVEHMAGVLADRDLSTMAYPNRLPVQGKAPRISSGFGVRHDPFTGRLARHMGLDIPAAHGTAILASGGGRVLSAGFRGPYGKAIVIDHGDGLQTLYGHCSKLYVRAGELVMPRQKIAAVGSTGRSTGPHLHFEVIRDGARVEPGRVLASVLARNSQ